jgi:hypothetical protein
MYGPVLQPKPEIMLVPIIPKCMYQFWPNLERNLGLWLAEFGTHLQLTIMTD